MKVSLLDGNSLYHRKMENPPTLCIDVGNRKLLTCKAVEGPLYLAVLLWCNAARCISLCFVVFFMLQDQEFCFSVPTEERL